MTPRFVSTPRVLTQLASAFIAAVGRLDKSLSPQDTIHKLRAHSFTFSDSIYIFHITLATFWLVVLREPLYIKLALPLLYALALLIPFTSQFFIPATPVFSWLLTLFGSSSIPAAYRPAVSVSFLPTLESVLYGANISDILTRYTNPVLDLIAWLPYGVLHYTLPFVVAAFLWLFRPKAALHFWAAAFGYMNIVGVVTQILLPCAAPWYELIYGLTPANYDVPGSAAGLARIDALFGGHGYQATFAKSPLVFGAFPSLHAGCATLEALTWAHFFPQTKKWAWGYTGVLYWATMYLTHHYLIDVVVGACLATAAFYLFLPEDLKGAGSGAPGAGRRSKHELYDLEAPRNSRRRARGHLAVSVDTDMESDASSPRDSEEQDITYRSPNPETATPHSGTAFITPMGPPAAAKNKRGPQSHRHTASIASLIRADERVEDGWSPIGGAGFAFPPTPVRPETVESGLGERRTGVGARGAS